MTPLEHLEIAVKEVGGQTKLAQLIGLTQPRVWNFLNRDKKVPAEYVIKICSIPEVSATPHDLRPDVFPIGMDITAA